MSLKSQTLAAFKWSVLGTFIRSGGSFIISIVLARLLSPEEFGIMGMAMVFVGISRALTDVGFSSAIIQKEEVSQLELSTVFYVNLGLSFTLSTIFFLMAPQVAVFYEEPRVELVTQVISVIFLIRGFGQVQLSLFTKNLDYATLARIEVIALVVSGTLAIIASYYGYGIWALILQQLLLAFTTTVLLWLFSRWRPSLQFKLSAIKELFDYGSRLFLATFFSAIYTRVDTILIGKLFSPAVLGFYSRALSFQSIIRTLSTNGLGVLFPAFSKKQNDPKALSEAFTKIFRAVSFLSLFLSGGFWLIAEDMFVIVLGEKWLPAVPYFRILVIMGYAFPVGSILLSVIKASGDSKLYLRLDIYRKLIMVPTFLLVIFDGIDSFLWGRVIVGMFVVMLNIFYTLKVIEGKFFDFVKILAAHYLLIASVVFLIEILGLGFESRILNLGLDGILYLLFVGIVTYLTQKKLIAGIRSIIKR